MCNRYGNRKYINLNNLVNILDSIVKGRTPSYQVCCKYNRITRELTWDFNYNLVLPESVRFGDGYYLVTEDYIKVILNLIDIYSDKFTNYSVRRLLYHLPLNKNCVGLSELEERIEKLKILVELLK